MLPSAETVVPPIPPHVQRVGLLGGTFDPIHFGHLIMAEQAREQAGLDLIAFVPAGDPPHKLGQSITPSHHRIEMIRLAIASNPACAICRLDVDRPGPHYSVDLVDLFHDQLPCHVELFFIIGGDSLRDLSTWKHPHELLRLCPVLALSRPGHEPDMDYLRSVLPEMDSRIQILEMPLIEISGRDLRQRVRMGRSIRYMVPETVRAYVAQHGLYPPLPATPEEPGASDTRQTSH